LFHKVAFEPERHVQELRFPFKESVNEIERHSMQDLSANLFKLAGANVAYTGGAAWLAALNDAKCTAALVDGQRASCAVASTGANALRVCPR